MTEITILAVTRLSDGVCVAGVTQDGQWVRPTRPTSLDWRQLEYSDCKDKSGAWAVRKGNIVAMDLAEPIPAEAHSEDLRIGRQAPVLVKQLPEAEYRQVCAELTEGSTAPIEGPDAKRSLMMVHPAKITSFSFDVEENWKGQKKYTPRCTFWLGGRLYRDRSVSDAEWREHGRHIRKKNGGDCRLTGEEVFRSLGIEDCWLTLGRNEVESNIYLMVIGVHLFPVRRFEMDFGR
jgi:hypothetical protein